jgi:hypothetical protein
LAEWPHRQREIIGRPPSPNAVPSESTTLKSPSIRMGPFELTTMRVDMTAFLK